MVRHQSYQIQIRQMHLYDGLQVPMFLSYLCDLRRYLFGCGMNRAVPGPADSLHLNLLQQWLKRPVFVFILVEICIFHLTNYWIRFLKKMTFSTSSDHTF